MIKIAILLALLFSNNPKEIAVINKFKKEAEKAFQAGNYQTAINHYRYLLDSMNIEEDEILLNLGHSYFQSKDTVNAKDYYARASMSNDLQLRSVAYQQLGVMAKNPQTLNESLQYLKSSLKSNPKNEGARYDYELVKKLLEEQQKQQQDQQNQENQDQQNQDQENQENQENQDQQNQDQQNQENQEEQEGDQNEQDQQNQDQQEKEGEQQDQQEQQQGEQKEQDQNQEMSTKEKLEQMNISEEKARMILEAMRNGEIQYLQQQKRKATKRPDSGKPDW